MADGRDVKPRWRKPGEGNSGFIPAGVPRAFLDTSDAMARVPFGVAPRHR